MLDMRHEAKFSKRACFWKASRHDEFYSMDCHTGSGFEKSLGMNDAHCISNYM